MVTAVEAVALLAFASGHDHRKRDDDTAAAWAEALADINYEDARSVILNHYRTSTDWLMVAHIVNGVRALESARIAAAPNLDELEPPESVTSLPDGDQFTAAYLAWRKEQARRVRRGLPLQVGPSPVLSSRQWNQLVS